MTTYSVRCVTLSAIAVFYALASMDVARAAEAVRMSDVVRRYTADSTDAEQFYNLGASALRSKRFDQLYADWLEKLAAIDFDALDQSGKVDYVLLRNSLEQSRAGLVREGQRIDQIDELLPFRETIYQLEAARLRGEPIDGQATATKLSRLMEQLKKLKERVEKGKTSAKADADKPATGKQASDKTTTADSSTGGRDSAVNAQAAPKPDAPLATTPTRALRAAGQISNLRHTLKSWFAFYDGFDPRLTWWLKKPCEDLDKQFEAYDKLLRQTIAQQKGEDHDPLVGDPIGPNAISEEIRFAFLPYSAAELIAIGERELAWGEMEMKKAAGEMGLGNDWHAALAKVKSDYVQPGEQSELITAIGREAIEFVRQHHFATIPPLCEETWQLSMLSPEETKTIPYAAYGGQNVMVAYANESMQQDDKVMVMRGNNRAFTRLTTMHELIPGHHLQRFQATRNNTYRGIFRTPFYVEGWALYCELQFWKLGWARTPQERMGMLFWRMNRAARIIVSLKYHLEQMTPEEMIDFMVQRVGHEKFGATSEVRRFIQASPLYQAGYLLGGLQLMALHDEMVGPGKMNDQQFHDAVLMANCMPIELLRIELRKLPLTRDAQSCWKFAGPAGQGSH